MLQSLHMQNHSELLQRLLTGRGIKTEAETEKFLNPDYQRDFHDPFLVKDMEKACVRIFEAVEGNEKIMIYSDYDVDGIPGAVILHDLFEKIGFKNFEIYIPQRNSEGYGLNLEAIREFAAEKVQLLITVDLGITATNEIAQAKAEEIDTVVLDHHLAGERLPHAYAILNPKVDNSAKNGTNYPEKMLCAAGVVFKLIQAFLKKYGQYYKIREGWEKWLLDMVGLATLSDMVPLLGENRTMASFGLKVLRKSPRVGLQKLLAQLRIEQKYLSEDDIGFMITPRLNAASRMDDPKRAFELLVTKDEAEAGALATHLIKINDDRKIVVASILREIKKKFQKREMKEIIVVGNPTWRIGVLGLIAGKLSDEYRRTVFVWGKDENECIKGSCRSDGSISIVELMTAASDHFSEFGGHELAGGFSVPSDKIHFLEEALVKSYARLRELKRPDLKDSQSPTLEYDIAGNLDLVNMKSWRDIEKLAPFGLGNPKPVFLFPKVAVEKIRKFGKNGSGEHLEINFSDDKNKKVKGISFFSSQESFTVPLAEGRKVNLLANFDLARFRGQEELRLRIVDIT